MDATNKDNFWTAYARAVKPQAIATTTPANCHIVAAMYPKRISTQHLHPQCPPSAHPIIPPSHAPPATLDLLGNIITSIRCQNKGRANGLCMDSINIFIRLANKNSSITNQALRLFFHRIHNGLVEPDMKPYFTNAYLFCLHKDPHDLSKLRPLGVPTAIRRIITNHPAHSLCSKFASHLLPYNFAVGIKGSMEFVIKASQLTVKKQITLPVMAGHAPLCCFVSLDLKNMFNEISQDQIFEVVEAKFPKILPLTKLHYTNPGQVFFKMANGAWHTQLMEEGVNQGCPLSSTIAAIVLHEVLAPLDAACENV